MSAEVVATFGTDAQKKAWLPGLADGSAKGGNSLFDATNDGIGVSPFYDAASKLPADMQTTIDAAIAGIADGSITTCPTDCGKTGIPIGD